MKNEIVIYKSQNREIKFNFDAKKETVWATREQIAELFNVDRTGIGRHLHNIFKTGELDKKMVCAKIAHTTRHGAIENKTQTQEVELYNLDAIISVGYRVNSNRATQFRIWATNTLREYIVKGIAINETRIKQLREHNLAELEDTVGVVKRLMINNELSADEASGVLDVITRYSDTWINLQKYDEGELTLPRKLAKPKFELTFDYALEAVAQLKKILISEKKATELFGNLRGDAFAGIVGNIYQSFDGTDIYPSIAEKAVNLLYLIIKDHPFSDGNKRIASFLFVLFVSQNHYNLTKNGEHKISDRTITALALLIAESKPDEKDLLVALVCRLLKEDE